MESLRAQVTTFIGVLGLLTPLGLNATAYWYTSERIADDFEARVALTGRLVERATVAHLDFQKKRQQRMAGREDLLQTLEPGADRARTLAYLNALVGARDEIEDMLVVDRDGVVVVSTRPDDEGEDLSSSAWWSRALSDVSVGAFERRRDDLSYVVTAPVQRDGGPVTGVLVTWCDVNAVYDLLETSRVESETAETYLVAADGTLMSPSRFVPNAELRSRLAGAPLDALRAGDATVARWADYRGEPVFGLVLNQGLRAAGAPWAIVTEVGERELLASTGRLRDFFAVMTFATFLVAVFAGYFVAGPIAVPLITLSGAMRRIGAGDLSVDLHRSRRADEIGVLTNAIADAVAHFRGIVGQLNSGVSQLSSSSSEIGATASQYAATAAEQAASVAEISTTVEEIKQMSRSAADAARQVADASDAAADLGRDGRERLDRSVDAMAVINTRVAGIANEILKLAEQTAQIGDILEAVGDLAEQSNLLAVNASIEAAKAGDHGRGFAVVASEVRSLAEQSKRSTQSIRTILNDVQKATQRAVMAAEEGTKRADDGRAAIESLRDVIDTLAGTLEENASRGRQIAGAAAQQASGISQIAAALDGVSKAGQEGAQGVKQLEGAVRDLTLLANELRKRSETFKL